METLQLVRPSAKTTGAPPLPTRAVPAGRIGRSPAQQQARGRRVETSNSERALHRAPIRMAPFHRKSLPHVVETERWTGPPKDAQGCARLDFTRSSFTNGVVFRNPSPRGAV